MMKSKKAKLVPVLVRIPEPLLRKVDAAATRSDRSRTYVVVEALRGRLEGRARSGV